MRSPIAWLALFVTLGGTTYAAVSLPRNSVGTRQLRNHAVTYAKLDTKAAARLRGAAGVAGPQGAAGPAGAQGPKGDAGPAGPAQLPDIQVASTGGGTITHTVADMVALTPIQLAAGNWWLTAMIVVQSPSTTNVAGSCTLDVPGVNSQSEPFFLAATQSVQTLSFSLAVSLTAAATQPALKCVTTTAGQTAGASTARVTAVPVKSISESD